MADLNTATYLKNNVGPALTKAMAALSAAQPNDAVDFLGRWLLQYADTEEARINSAKEQERLAAARAKRQEELKAEAAEKQRIEDEAAAKVKRREDLIQSLNEATQWSETCFDELVAVAQESANARQVYLGWVDEDADEGEGGGAVVRYSNVTGPDAAQNELMLKSTLPGGGGVTMGVFEEKQPPDAGEGATEVPEGFRKFDAVWVPEVTDHAQVHYFDLTRLGSYLAVPLIYNTYYHEDALVAALDHEKNTAEVVAANEAAKATPTEDGSDPVLQELPVLALPGKPVKMVICLDTLCHANNGDTKMDEATAVPAVFGLCDAAAAGKTKCEEIEILNQAKTLLLEDKKAEMLDTYNKATEAEEASRQSNSVAAIGELPEDAPNELKELVDLEHKYLKARNVFLAMAGYVTDMAGYVLVDKEVMASLAACALLVGRPKEQVFIRNKNPVNGVRSMAWTQVKKQVNQDLFDKAKGFEPKGPRKGLDTTQKVEFVKGLAPGDMDEAKALETRAGPAFAALLLYVQTALAYRAADVAMRKEEHSKKLRAAEDEGGEMPPPLGDIDDDFVD